MKKIINLSALLIFLFLFSCSSKQTKNNYANVGSESDSELHSISIDPNKADEDLYGPVAPQNLNANNENLSTQKIGFIVDCSHYDSYEFIGILKFLEQKKILPTFVISKGFGSVFAAEYAMNKSISKLEWFIFKYSNKDNFKIYSKGWKNYWEDNLEDHFKELNIEKSKILFHLLLEDKIIKDGKLVDNLKKYLNEAPEDENIDIKNSLSYLESIGIKKIFIFSKDDLNDLENADVKLIKLENKPEQKSSVVFINQQIQEGYRKAQSSYGEIQNFLE